MANMGLNRRTFLQKAGLGLAALGVSETVLSLLGDKSLAVPLLERYFQVLAQPGGRKLALLVGINEYPRTTALAGCVTDVELQRELLIHRFGFNANDIVTLTNSQATRETIETAFIEHLTKQAEAGDVVVFHFSGYGSQVQMPQQEATADPSVSLQNSFVPVDGILPTKGEPVANDFLAETLALLLRSLKTDQVTTVLDTSHTQAVNVFKGSLKVRSSPRKSAPAPNPDELAFQEQLVQRLKASSKPWKLLDKSMEMPGLVLAAAGSSQPATEVQWNGFSAGLFTYALTQHLWQATAATSVQISVSRTAGIVNQFVGNNQQPQLIGQKSQNSLLAYYLSPNPPLGADGVVTAIEENGKVAQLWLAGLPAPVLEYYSPNSVLELLNEKLLSLPPSQSDKSPATDNPAQPAPKSVQLQLRSKDGLTAKARILSGNSGENVQPQVGQLVRERIRVLPRNLGLTIALDTHLERIERVDATSAFASIPSVSSVVVAGEQTADYLFGRGKKQATETSEPKFKGGYGLFSIVRNPIPNSLGEEAEAVKSAVNRLSGKFKTLLAMKWLRLSANEGSSRLGIRASLEMIAPETKTIIQRETWRTASGLSTDKTKKNAGNAVPSVGSATMPRLPIGSRVQYRLENYSDRPLYFLLLGLESSGSAIAFYQQNPSPEGLESQKNSPPLSGAIKPGETLILPKPSASFNWTVPGPVGVTEMQLICSPSPFKGAIAALESAMRPKGEGERVGDLFNPLEVTRAILQDLHQASSITPDKFGIGSDMYALDVNAWATLSFNYQVVS
ncbi:MAG: caspase family protein [Coleofasciculus sp. G1-WW12-02]|uniref:caspase family protein n=1 Tax=Coleofasciculus sp. G1-WW12-02 TaxID=3068483 RepID=UPI0032FB6A5E